MRGLTLDATANSASSEHHPLEATGRLTQRSKRLLAGVSVLILIAAGATYALWWSGRDEGGLLVLPQNLDPGWALLRAQRPAPNDGTGFGEFIFLAEDAAQGGYLRTIMVDRIDGNEEPPPLEGADPATENEFTELRFATDSCGAISFKTTGLSVEESRKVARTVHCNGSGLRVDAPSRMMTRCRSHYRDERVAVFVVGKPNGPTAVFHILDNDCPLAMYVGQSTVIDGRTVLFDDDFDNDRVDCFLKFRGSVIWGQHLQSDKQTARADLEALIKELRVVSADKFDHALDQ